MPAGIVLAARIAKPIDKVLGDFSYPIYLVHPLFLIVIIDGPYGQIVAMGGTLLICALIIVFIEMPIDKFRQTRVSH